MAPPEEKKPSVRETRLAMYKGMGGYGTLGLEMILSVAFGAFVGNWADGKLGTGPWLTLLGGALGVGAAVRAIQRALRMLNREAAREEREQGNPKPIFETSEDRSTRLREARKQREVKTGDETEEASSNEPSETTEPPTPPAKRDPALGSSVRATALATVVLSIVCAIAVDPWFALGTLIGGMLATANLVLFIRIVETFVAQTQAGKAVPWALLWALKLAGLFLCAFVILRRGDVNALAFVIGYGALPIGIAVSSLFGKPPAETAAKGS